MKQECPSLEGRPKRDTKPSLVYGILTAVVIAGLALALVAPEASANVATPPDGYHTVTVKKAGFSMAIPDTWLVVDATSKNFRDQMQKVADANPQLGPLVEQVDPSFSKLFAADQTNLTFSNNVQVVAVDYDKSVISQPKAVKAGLEALETFQDIEVTKTKFAGRRALGVHATFDVNSPEGTSVRVHSTSYLVAAKKGVLQIVFSTLEDGRQDPTVQTMVDNFKFVR